MHTQSCSLSLSPLSEATWKKKIHTHTKKKMVNATRDTFHETMFCPSTCIARKTSFEKTSIKHVKYLGFAITSLMKYLFPSEICCSETSYKTLKTCYFETRRHVTKPRRSQVRFVERGSVPANRKELHIFKQMIRDSRISTHSGNRFLSNSFTKIECPSSPILCAKKEEKTTRWHWSNAQESVGRVIKHEHRAAFHPSF